MMTPFQLVTATVLLAIALCRAASGDIIVLFTGPEGNDIDFDIVHNSQSGEWEVYLNHTRNGSGGDFHIRSTSNGNDVISFIRCNMTDAAGVGVLVEENPNAGNALVKTVRSIYSVNTAPIHVYECIVTHDVGSIVTYQILSVEAGGDVAGPLTADSGQHIDLVSAGDAITADITATGSSGSYIKNIEAGGAVGSVGDPISITTYEYVRRLTGTSVNANIDITGSGAGNGAFGRLVATSGDFTGSLTCERIVPINQGQYNVDFEIAGDLDADIVCSRYLQGDVTLYIDGNLDGSIDFTSSTESQLQGQIIINAGNNSGGWNGTITVDGATLAGPNYTQTSAAIGGGAVGLAPFNFHATNCVPADNTTVTSEPASVTLSHYGPVEKYGSASIAELTIIRHLTTSPCALCDETVTGDFSWEYAANGRDIVITPQEGEAFEDGYDYHITPVTSGSAILRCSGVTGNPAVQS